MKIGNYRFFFKTKYEYLPNEEKFYIVDSKISNKFSIYYDSVGKYLKVIRKGKQRVYYITKNRYHYDSAIFKYYVTFQTWSDLYYDGKSISTNFYN